jgi:two-component system LytT family response regulator
VRDGERCWFVPLAEVRLLESEGNYTRLFWKDERPFLGRSLVALEQRLPPSRFFRANRRHIIALDFVAKVEMGAAGRLDVTLRGGPTVEVSRRQARLFRQAMNV